MRRQGGDADGRRAHMQPRTALGRGREGVGTQTAVRNAPRGGGWRAGLRAQAGAGIGDLSGRRQLGAEGGSRRFRPE